MSANLDQELEYQPCVCVDIISAKMHLMSHRSARAITLSLWHNWRAEPKSRKSKCLKPSQVNRKRKKPAKTANSILIAVTFALLLSCYTCRQPSQVSQNTRASTLNRSCLAHLAPFVFLLESGSALRLGINDDGQLCPEATTHGCPVL